MSNLSCKNSGIGEAQDLLIKPNVAFHQERVQYGDRFGVQVPQMISMRVCVGRHLDMGQSAYADKTVTKYSHSARLLFNKFHLLHRVIGRGWQVLPLPPEVEKGAPWLGAPPPLCSPVGARRCPIVLRRGLAMDIPF